MVLLSTIVLELSRARRARGAARGSPGVDGALRGGRPGPGARQPGPPGCRRPEPGGEPGPMPGGHGPRPPASHVEIGGRLGVAKSAVTKTIDRLEERGLLVRERDPGDRRTVYATLSPAGHQLFAAAQPAFLDAVERHFTSHIDYDTLAHLAELPARITAAAVGAERKTR